MADPNVLGLNIELQLSSEKFQSQLQAFTDTQMLKFSSDLSKKISEGFSGGNLDSLTKQFDQAAVMGAEIPASMVFNEPATQLQEFSEKLAQTSAIAPPVAFIDSMRDLVTTFFELVDVQRNYEDAILKSSTNDEIMKTVELIGMENDGLRQVAKNIAIKNRGHVEQTRRVEESNDSIRDMNDEVRNTRDGVGSTADLWNKAKALLKGIYDGIIKASQAAEDFVTANFRAYGHQEAIIGQTDMMIAQYGLLEKTAFKATKALMEEGLQPDKIKEATVMVSKFERFTGVAAEQLAGFVKQSEVMGLTVSDTANTLLIYEDAQKKYNLSTAEAATLMKKLDVPGKTAERMFLKNAKAVREFAATKAQVAGFAKQVGANVGEVVGLFDKVAEGSFEAMVGLMAFSGISTLTTGNMMKAYTMAGREFKSMLAAAGDDALSKAAIMDTLRKTSGMTTGQIEAAIQAYEEEKKAIKAISDATGLTIKAATKEYERRQMIIKQQRELKAQNPAAYLAKMNGEWSESTDNLAASYQRFKDVFEALGDVFYQLFMPGLKLIFDLLIKLGIQLAALIQWVRETYNSFMTFLGVSEETERQIRAWGGAIAIALGVLILFGVITGKGAMIVSLLGAVVMWVGGLIAGWLGLTPIIAGMGGSFATLGGVLAGFFAALTPVRKTILMVSASVLMLATSAVIMYYAVKSFMGLDWGEFGKGILMVSITFAILAGALALVSLAAGLASGPLWSASAAILAMGVATILVAVALQMVTSINWGVLAGAAVTMLGLMAALTLFAAWISTVGWVAVAGLLAIGAAAMMIGAGLYLAAAALQVVGYAMAFMAGLSSEIRVLVEVLAQFVAAMFLITIQTIPFGIAILALGVALYAFTWELWSCGQRIGLFAEQLLAFGVALIMIRDGMAGINSASSSMGSQIDATANSMLRLSAQLKDFPTSKMFAMADSMKALNANANAAAIVGSVSVAVDKLAGAAKEIQNVDQFSKSMSDLLIQVTNNEKGVDLFSKIGSSFAMIGMAMKSMTNVGTILTSFYEGINRFADIGKIPENLAKVGAAMRKVPGLSAQVAAPPPTIEGDVEQLQDMKKNMSEAVNALAPMGAQIRDAMVSIQSAIPFMFQTSVMFKIAVDELYDSAYYLPTTAKWLKDGGADLSAASNSMTQAMANGKSMQENAAQFISAMKYITKGMDEVQFYNFYYKMRDFRDATDFLVKAKSNLNGVSNAVRDFANALLQLANAIAGLKNYGTIRFDAKGMMEAATEAKDSVMKYQKAVEGTQKSLDASKKSKDSQPINQVQTKTDGANAATGSYDSKMYDELLTLNELMRQLLAKNAAGANSPTAVASNQASDSNSFTMNGWT